MSLRLFALLAASLALPGCAHKPECVADSQADCVPGAQATTTFYKGAVTVHLADGRSFPGAVTYVKRTVEPAKGIITELVIQASSRKGEKPREFVVTMKVNGAHFTMTERSQSFSGDGDLVGPAWAWTEWTSRSVMPDGNLVESHDTLVGTGLQTEKKLKDAQGQVQVTLNEDFAAIAKAAFEKARTDILNPPAEELPTSLPGVIQ
jgi:hypothetical protein